MGYIDWRGLVMVYEMCKRAAFSVIHGMDYSQDGIRLGDRIESMGSRLMGSINPISFCILI